MMNPFISYLNSLHNEQASNQNAIAEMQIQSDFFATMQVERDLIGFLCDKLRNGEFVVLTGHAGDGKTTLLAQVLDELGAHQSILNERDEINCGFSLRYIKDFSELTHDEQDDELSTCFRRQGASLLIANTGPLLLAMERIAPNGDALEEILLEAMDQPAGQAVLIPDIGEVFLLNIARVDNTDFIRPYLNNIIADVHWQTCDGCSCRERCPMLLNRTLLRERFDRASTFIENSYLWLQEYDQRATIRQITAHLSYAMTGGFTCEAVQYKGTPILRYYYLFSNLFWGSRGKADDPAAQQIRGIRLMQGTGFDKKTTSIDYDLFIKNDMHSYFNTTLSELFDGVAPLIRSIPISIRHRILKRAFLLFGQEPSEQSAIVRAQVFSEWFDEYLDGRSNRTRLKSKTKNAICRAINTLFVGETSDESISTIYLTLRRNNEQTSNVQLLRGQIPTSDVAFRYDPVDSISANSQQHRLFMNIGDMRFHIGLPLLNYFSEIKNGVIMTDVDPLLSNGIDSMKAQLLSHFSHESDGDETMVLFLKGSTWQKRKLMIGNGRIEHE